MSTRLVSFLGLGPVDSEPPHYSEAIYELDGRRAERTPLLERALLDLVPEIDSIVVLGTKDVERRWFDTGLIEEFLDRRPWFVQLPHGESTEERWEIFTSTVEALCAGPLESAGEIEAPDQIVVDVTHGYRSHPLLGMAAVHHAVSEQTRQGAEEPPAIRIVYGAFDAKVGDSGVSPIWDLTEFVLSSQWNSALDALMRFGRADDLERLGEIEMRAYTARLRAAGKRGADLGEANFPRVLGRAARELADDLALARLRDLLVGPNEGQIGSAERLLRLIESDSAQRFRHRLPPVRESMSRLVEWLEPLRASSIVSPEGLTAMAPLARLYGQLQRFAEQAALIREGLVSHYTLATGRDDIVEPGANGCHESRLRTERVWSAMVQRHRSVRDEDLPAPVGENIRVSSGMVQPRNDIEHCGLKDKPSPAKNLRKQLDRSSAAFIELVEVPPEKTTVHFQTNTTSSPGNSDSCFVNLSNHPVSEWSEEQLTKARTLGLGEPVDLERGMPLVSPEADTQEVVEQALQIAGRAFEQGATGALVMTEYTLTQALVSTLQRRGVRCFAATTERKIEETVDRQGGIVKKSVFRFARWREYANAD